MPSVEQPPEATGPSLTVSPEETIRQALEEREGLRRLGLMAGLRSINRNLRTEDAAVAAHQAAQHRELFGGGDMPQAGADDMDIMAARDVIVQHPQAAQAPSGPSGQPGWSSVLPWALAAALGGGMANQWFRPAPSPAPVQQQQQGQDTDTQYELRISGE